MWLLPALAGLSRLATRTYYRFRVDGVGVPATGPVLLVANHPNSLLDPGVVLAVAGRPVRFLARAGLFDEKAIAWLVRGAGAIPVYRRQDDSSQMERNADAFSAAFRELAAGAAVGIFPEGVTHHEPSLAPLRTGAARIALGAAQQYGGAFPIVPIGLVLRERHVFRSEARVLIGAPVAWDDLAAASENDFDAVRALTARIDNALRGVTVNLESWEDASLVLATDAIWTAEFGLPSSDVEQVQRIRRGTEKLAALRARGNPEWAALAKDITRHDRLLRRLGLAPAELLGDFRYGEAALWTVRRLPLVTLATVAVGTAGAVLFWLPYWVTGRVSRRIRPDRTGRSTAHVMTGIPIYLMWIAAAAVAAYFITGPAAAVFTALAMPPAAIATMLVHERWRDSVRDIRRFYVKRSRASLIADLRVRQKRIAERLLRVLRPEESALRDAIRRPPAPATVPPPAVLHATPVVPGFSASARAPLPDADAAPPSALRADANRPEPPQPVRVSPGE